MQRGLIVLVGAGASYDCWVQGYRELQFRPPLASEIFGINPEIEQIQCRHQGALAPIQTYRERREQGVEKFLAQLEAEGGISKRQAADVRMYIHDYISSVTLKYLTRDGRAATKYTALVDALRRLPYAQTAYVNLNYDLLLDFALEQVFRIQPKEWIRPVGGTLHHVKPHGSVNWAIRDKQPQRVTVDRVFELFAATDQIEHFDGWMNPFRIAWDTNVAQRVPAIVPPLANKCSVLCPPPVIDTFLGTFRGLNEIDVLTIGFSAVDDDIRELLAPLLPMVVSVHVVDVKKCIGNVTQRLRGWKMGPYAPTQFDTGFSQLNLAELSQSLDRGRRTGGSITRRVATGETEHWDS